MADLSAARLRCEYLANPLNVGRERPRLFWDCVSNAPGARQTAYRVACASSLDDLEAGRLVWDSGRVESSSSIHVEYQGPALASSQQVFWRVKLWDGEGREGSWSEPAHWTRALKTREEWQAKWIGRPEPTGPAEDAWRKAVTENSPEKPFPFDPAACLRKEFPVAVKPARALLYVTALGCHEMSLNGKRTADDVLSPGWTDTNKRVLTHCSDVTNLMVEGANCLSAWLGDGWQCSYLAFSGRRFYYSRVPRLLASLHLLHQDGRVEVVGTDDTWQLGEGEVRENDLLMGTTIDLNRKVEGWQLPGFPGGWDRATSHDADPPLILPHPGSPVVRQEVVAAKSVKQSADGSWIVDFGQNLVGWVAFRGLAVPGKDVVVRHAERLDADGSLYLANIRSAKATDTYRVQAAGVHEFEPKFTFHGFQYCSISGLAEPPRAEDIRAVVMHSNMERIGQFRSSNPLLDRLVENSDWSLKGNGLDLFTDCPQRDERAGWTGDMAAFARTAFYLRDIGPMMAKWLYDLCHDAQREDGALADVAPYVSIVSFGNAGWEDAGPICTRCSLDFMKDERVAKEHLEPIERYISFLQKSARDGIRGAGSYGDWLQLNSIQHSEALATAFACYSCTTAAEAAESAGDQDLQAKFLAAAEEFKKAFRRTFVSADETVVEKDFESQSFYAAGIKMGVIDAVKTAGLHLSRRIREQGGLATGFMGTPYLLESLRQCGRPDLAWDLLLNEEYPGWLYQVKLGATSMWERWDGWTPEKGFQDPGMNSFNHFWIGCVSGWIFEHAGGISVRRDGLVIDPCLTKRLTHVECSHRLLQGEVKVRWEWKGSAVELAVSLPANVEALLGLPDHDDLELLQGRVEETGTRSEFGSQLCRIGSGVTVARFVPAAE